MRPRLFSQWYARALIALTPVLGITGLVACFSDRATSATPTNSVSCTVPSSTAGATIVFINQFAFIPPTVHVKAGQNVAWVNCEAGATPHTVTADGGAFTSGTLHTPDAFVQSFPAAGTFPYHCAIHPSMKASVVVD